MEDVLEEALEEDLLYVPSNDRKIFKDNTNLDDDLIHTTDNLVNNLSTINRNKLKLRNKIVL